MSKDNKTNENHEISEVIYTSLLSIRTLIPNRAERPV